MTREEQAAFTLPDGRLGDNCNDLLCGSDSITSKGLYQTKVAVSIWEILDYMLNSIAISFIEIRRLKAVTSSKDCVAFVSYRFFFRCL